MILADTLEARLQEINTHAEQMSDRLVRTIAEDENVTDQLKIDEPSEWVTSINNIHVHAREIVNDVLIFE